MSRKHGTLWHKIKELKSQENRFSLRLKVLDYIQISFWEDDEIKSFFQNLLVNGGVGSGMIPHLISRSDTNQFFVDYYEDIQKLKENVSENPQKHNLNDPIQLVWFGFEETARQIANDLNIKV